MKRDCSFFAKSLFAKNKLGFCVAFVLVAGLIITSALPVWATPRSLTASVSGNWDDSATWGGNSKPVAGDTVTINSGITVTVAADAAAASITFPSSSSSVSRVSVNSGVTLTISGAVTLPEGSGAGSNTLAVGSGTVSAGSIDFTNALNAKKHTVSISTGTLTVSGNITIDGSNKKSASLTFTGAGTLNLAGALFTGSNNATLLTTVAGSTINYNGSGAQTVRTHAYLGNLTLSGSGAKSMASGTSVAGIMSIAPTGTATASIAAAQTLTVETLKLAAVGRTNGTWGSTTSSATNTNNTYFAATTGKLSVTTSSVDTTAPTISNVTSTLANGTYKAGQVIDINVTFSEAVTSTGSVTVNLNTSRSCTFTVTASSTGTCNYTVQSGDTTSDLNVSSISGTIADAAGNAMASFSPATNLATNKDLVIDTTAPTVTNVTSSTTNGSYKVGGVISIQVTFSEAVTVTGTPQLTLETGSTDRTVNYASGSGGTTLTFTYTVQTGDTSSDLDYTGTTALALNSGTITDAATNAATLTLPSPGATGSLGANKAIVIDATAPTVLRVTSSNANGNYKAGDLIVIQVVFSEAVTVSNTPHIVLLTGSPNTKTINYTSGSGTDTLEFDYTVGSNNYSSDLEYASTGALSTSSSGSAATIQDAAGNAAVTTLATPGAAGSLGYNKNIVIDSIAPTVVLSSTAPTLTNVAIPVTATFSESVTGFVVGDISVTNGTAGSFSGSGSTYTFVVTPSGQGSVSVSLLSSVAQDVGGNLSSASNTITRTYDSIAPTVALTTTTTSPTLTSPISYTATFSEAVTGFTVSDISATNASVGNFHTVNSRVYTFDVSPVSDPILNVDVNTSVDAGKAQDAAGNYNTASDSGTPSYIRFDNHSPTVALTSTATEYVSSSPFTVTATFSESVTEFVVGDISVTNGSAGNFAGSGTTYTFDITPSGQGAVTVSIAAGVAHDVAVNLNLASNVFSTIYDTGAPTVALTTTASNPTNSASFSVSATFSEEVTGFDGTTISVTNGTADHFVRESATLYLFDVTPTDQGVVDISIPELSGQDGAGNGNAVSNTLSITYDSVGSTLAEVTPVPALGTDATPNYTFSSTEAGTVTYEGSCNASTSSISSGSTTITFNTLANGTYNDCSITVTDAAGNLSTPLIVTAFTIDSSDPTVTTYSPSNNATSVSATANLVLTFDKNVVVGTGNILIKTGSTTVETIDVTGVKVTGSGTSIITINPSTTLASQTTYYVQINATAFDDTFGNSYAGIADSTTWSFTTADTTAPTVTTLAPANNSTGASVNPFLIMTFSENVVAQSGGFVTIRKADNSIVEDISVTNVSKVSGSGTTVITIDPSTALDGLTNYHITVTAGAFADTSSNAYAGISDATTWTFQTLDTSNPFISTFSPANFATGVSATANLVMTFDRAVYAQTGNITIKTGSTTVETISVTDAKVTGSGTTTITVNPATTLSSQTSYYVLIDAAAFNDVTDGTGNSFDGIASTTTWTFTTLDTTAPTLSSVALSSNNSLSSSQAKVGDTVTLSFAASETISTPTVSFSSGGVAVTNAVTVTNTSGNNWLASYITNTSDTTGAVTYSINSYHDAANNSGATVTSGSGSVTFDKTVPSLSSVTLTSNNATNTQAKVGNIITLAFTASETISTPTVNFSSGGAGVANAVTVTNTSGNNWTATYTTSSSDTAGDVTYSISSYHDNANNAGATVTSGSGSVNFDKTAPTLSSVTPTTSSFLTNVTSASGITFTSSETLATGSISITRTSGTADGTVHTCTLTGTALSSGSHTINLSDTTNGCTSDVSNLVSGTVYTFVFAGSDLAGNTASSVTRTSVTFDNTAPTLSSITPTTTSFLTNVTSASGINFTTSEALASGSITITQTSGSTDDNSPHTCTLTGTALDSGSHTINLVDSINGCTSDVSNLVSGAVYTFVFAGSDVAGNAATAVTRTAVTFDNTAPSLSSVTPTTTSFLTNVTSASGMAFTSSEALASGSITITQTSGSTDDNSPHTCTLTGTALNSGSHTINLSDTTNGCSSDVSNLVSGAVYTFVFAGSDAAGNTASSVTRTAVTFDNTVPTLSSVTLTSNNSTPTQAKVGNVITLAFTASETISAPTVTFSSGGDAVTNAVTVTNTSGNDWTATYTTSSSDTNGALTYSINSYHDDASNNGATVTSGSGSVTFDKTAPTITSVSSNKTNGTYTIGESIDIRITFSEAVTSTGSVTVNLDTGRSCTFTVAASTTGTCNYVVQSGDLSSDLDVSSISGTLADAAGNALTDFTPATNLAANKAIVIDTNILDTNPPTIADVTSTKANGAYTTGEVIEIDVSFSEVVTSTGSVTVNLNTGRSCAFTVTADVTGSCDYTVQAGDTASDLNVSSISGTIEDVSLNPMTDFVPGTNLATNKAIVIDTTNPTLSSVTPTSSSLINNVTSASGIAFTSSEALGSGSITITRTSGTADGTVHTCTLAGTALNSGSHTINLSDTTNGCSSDVSNLVSGAVYTFVFAGSDAASNAASAVTRTGVTFDNTIPTLSSVTLASSNSTPTQAKVGNLITLSFTASETISTPSVAFSSGGDAVTNVITVTNTSGNNWTAMYVTSSSDTTGAITYSINSFHDDASNNGATVTSGSGSINFDKAVPSIAITAFAKTAHAAITTTTIRVTDNNAILNSAVSVSGTATPTDLDCTQTSSSQVDCVVKITTTGTLLVDATDIAGNAAIQATETGYVIDTTAPAILITAPTKTATATISNTTIRVTDDTNLSAADVSVGGSATPTALNCSQTSATQVDCTVNITTSGTLLVDAMDSVGNSASQGSVTDYVITAPPAAAPHILSVTAQPTTASTEVTWTTDAVASSQIEYGVDASYGALSTTTDTSPRVTNHTMRLSSLVVCTTYHYRVISVSADAMSTTSADQQFTTTGCAGDATVASESDQEVTSTGATVTNQNSTSSISVAMPANFSNTYSSVVIQIKALDSSTVLGSIGMPDGVESVGSSVFDVKALIDETTLLDSFDAPVTITLTYLAADIDNIDESTLQAYHYNNGVWTPLDNCVVDTAAKTVTCNTASFSVFGLFGQPITAATTERSIVDVQGAKHGKINVTYSDDTSHYYKIFTRAKKGRTLVKQYGTTNDWLVLSPKSRKLSLVAVDSGTILSTVQLMQHGRHTQHNIFLKNLISNKDQLKEAIIVSKGQHYARLSVVQVDDDLKTLTKKSVAKQLSNEVQPQDTTISRNKITLHGKTNDLMASFRVSQRYHLRNLLP